MLRDAAAADGTLYKLLGAAPAEAGVPAWLKEDLRVALEAYFASNWRVLCACLAGVLLKRLVGESWSGEREGSDRTSGRGGDVDNSWTMTLTFEENYSIWVSA